MASPLKHIGRVKSSKAKVLVAFKTIPGDPTSCLVIPTAALNDSYHNSIITLVESDQAQETNELAEMLSIRFFPDGRPMLPALHVDGKLFKYKTSEIEMTPTTTDVISLDALNNLIAEQKGVTLDQLSVQPRSDAKEIVKVTDLNKDVGEPTIPVPPAAIKASPNEVLSDSDIAKGLRSQADAMYKEAARLRREADDLDPPKKKTTKVTEETSA
jgi:hypothetical protein